MESRSGFGRSSPPHGARSRRGPEGGVDLISALPDEMLLLVLVRLRSVSAAAQTSIMSRQWLGLWTGLTDLTLRDLKPSAIEAALASFTSSPPVSIIDIRLSARHAAHASSMLRAAVRLSPEELAFTLQGCYNGGRETVVLPYFHCATSIELDMHTHRIKPPEESYAGAFSALEELSLSGAIIHLGFLLNRCPRLRVLKVSGSTPDIMVHSATLQELDISSDYDTPCYNIDVVTPVLKKLQLTLPASWNNIGVSISAPMVETVSWKRSYPRFAFSVGFWSLESLAIETTERYIDTRDDTCSQVQKLSRFHVLRLRISAITNHLGAQVNFAQEIQKLPVINFPLLELYFISSGHVYGALVMHLLQISRILSSTKMLKVIQWLCPKVRQTCQANCPCDEPKN